MPTRWTRFRRTSIVLPCALRRRRRGASGPCGRGRAVRAPRIWQPGLVFEIEGGETVTSAPELARLTLNIATAHTDATGSSHGQRLVYGGHTISIAAAHATRALPRLATIVAWAGCDHLGPVFEGDVLRTELRVEAVEPAADGALVDLQALVSAHRADAEAPVLDWRFVALVA